jgi:hypothetical protein
VNEVCATLCPHFSRINARRKASDGEDILSLEECFCLSGELKCYHHSPLTPFISHIGPRINGEIKSKAKILTYVKCAHTGVENFCSF